MNSRSDPHTGQTTAPLRCWLIGADSLLAECGELLIAAGHAIHGVVAPAGRARDWAEAHALTVLAPDSAYAAVLAQRPFDHLFAITHLARVPDDVLRLPARSAINFHDGPLPDYAGRNATVWAIVHGEKRYGVTWHVMTSVIDAGAILKQQIFDVAPDETALSLNTKCFEAALDTFGELLAELAAQSERPIAQLDGARHTFTRHARPAAACALDWSRPAQELEALVRALDFGRYPNPVGLAKCARNGRVFAVTQASAIAHVPPENGVPVPPHGTVLELDASGVFVATGSGVLALRGCADLCGRPVSPTALALALELTPGAHLDPLSTVDARRLSLLDTRASRAEDACVRGLAGLDAMTLPVPVAVAEPGTPARAAALRIGVPPGLSARFGGQPLATLLIAAFGVHLARLARRSSFDIGYADAALRGDVSGLSAWLSARVPLRITIAPDESFAALAERVAVSLAEIRTRGPWLHDTIARHPELHDLRETGAGELLPVAVECCASFTEPALADGAQWTLEIAEDSGECRCTYDSRRVSLEHARSLQRGFGALLASLAAQPALALPAHVIASPEERERQLGEWNRTARPQRRDVCIHELVAEQARRTPGAIAVVCDGHTLTYAELATRADSLAAELRALGVRRGSLVGISLDRSLELVVAMLGTLIAGGAYVPLDPAFPAQRIAFMVADAELGVIVTQTRLAPTLPASGAKLLLVDPSVAPAPAPPMGRTADDARPSDLAYVIYTSGSTGQPKGVLVEHRSVASFCAAMDEHVAHDPPGVWLAVTSLSFDISVLELLWTLTRGFKVVLQSGREPAPSPTTASTRTIDFSLFYFSSDDGGDRGAGYRLLREGALFADANGFRAVWTPERHFHDFGGLYPNPAVTGAALAAITSRVEIRAGSVVLPLHHPIRVAEEWALVDNLSNGRVGISFASGWHPHDFVLAPQNQRAAKAVMFRDIDVVRRLWRGEVIAFLGADGNAVDVRTRPRPVQPELPMWITSAGNAATFVEAGRIGANVLTHLLGQSIEELAPKIAAYREARAAAGFDPATGVVSLMLHTFIGEDDERVREAVREPLENYLASSLSLVAQHTTSFPAFRRTNGDVVDHSAEPDASEIATLAPEERAALLAHARDRYYRTSGLFGTPERCGERVEELRAIGVDEIACLIDFGVPVDDVLASLVFLDRVRRQAQERRTTDAERADASHAELIERDGVTHLQCTPSMARVLCSDPDTREALRNVKHLFVGGEALPEELASELAALCGEVTNMYGPTETTIWSSTQRIDSERRRASPLGTTPIGRPIANTSFYVLDEGLQPLPIGVAGELVIGGDGVARGYLRRPELDAQRFVPDPFAGAADARMYRTGDLVRYRSDGVLDFLGRTDQQIKVRGHRIEPGEIESLLAREPAVREAVVVAREDTPGDQRLVAYVVARGAAPDAASLRERLEAQLPAYMVPSQFVFLERIPRTPNAKIDRRALPAPETLARKSAESVSPANELETELARLWRSTLGVERVGVEDNFFDLGGHSVLAVRIHRRLRELTAQPVTLTDLFRFPTIRSLARFLTSEATSGELDEATLRGRRRRRSLQRESLRIGEA